MFTGLDLIVIFLAVWLVIYATSADGGGSGGSGSKPEPLTLIVMVIVAGMILMSFL